LLATVRNILQLENSKKGNPLLLVHGNNEQFYIVDMYVNNNNKMAHIVGFVWQKWLRKRSVMLRCILHILSKIE
jgi:hypothetical protein